MQAINTNNSRTQPNFDVLSIDCTTHDELLIEASMQNSQQILKFQPKHWRMKSVKVMSQQRDQNQNPTNTNYTLFRQFNYKLSSFLPAMPRALSNLSQTSILEKLQKHKRVNTFWKWFIVFIVNITRVAICIHLKARKITRSTHSAQTWGWVCRLLMIVLFIVR